MKVVCAYCTCAEISALGRSTRWWWITSGSRADPGAKKSQIRTLRHSFSLTHSHTHARNKISFLFLIHIYISYPKTWGYNAASVCLNSHISIGLKWIDVWQLAQEQQLAKNCKCVTDCVSELGWRQIAHLINKFHKTSPWVETY